MMKKLTFFSAFMVALLSLSACEGTMEGVRRDFDSIQDTGFFSSSGTGKRSAATAEDFIADGSCPKAQIVTELGAMSVFTNDYYPTEDRLVSRAIMNEVGSVCTTAGATMSVDLTVDFEGFLGPQAAYDAAGTPTFTYPYFVAVVSPKGTIMAKEIFDVTMNFAPGYESAARSETLRQVIPLASGTDGNQYKVMAGFQLNDEQLAYNRRIIAESAVPPPVVAGPGVDAVVIESKTIIEAEPLPIDDGPVVIVPPDNY